MRVQFLTAREAADLITDNSSIAINGFVGIGAAEEIQEKLKERFEETKSPRNLVLYYAAGQGDGKERALNLLDGEGLLKRVVGGHWNLAPKLQKLVLDNKIEAYNFPQGVIYQEKRLPLVRLAWRLLWILLKAVENLMI